MKNNPNHKINPLKRVIIRKKKIIKCVNCRNDIPTDDTPIVNCSQCNGDLCNKCGNNHTLRKPNHKIIMIKYILPKNKGDNCDKCGIELKNEDNYKKCENCSVPLCDECGDNHKIVCPNHRIKVVKRRINKNKVINLHCPLCDEKFPVNNNDNVNHYDDCLGQICKECYKTHNNKYPYHKIKVVKYRFINNSEFQDNKNKLLKCINCNQDLDQDINEPIQYCSHCNGNICYQCEKEHIKRKLNHKINLVRYIVLDDNEESEDNDDNEKYVKSDKKINCNKCGISLEGDDNYNGKINACDKCRINLCDNCTINHSKNHPKHTIRVIKRKIYKTINDDDNNKIADKIYKDKYKCNICKKDLFIRNGLKINYCENCKENLCDVCKDMHYANNPGHKILNPSCFI